MWVDVQEAQDQGALGGTVGGGDGRSRSTAQHGAAMHSGRGTAEAAAAASCLFLFLTRSRLRHLSEAMARPHAFIGRRSCGKYLSKASFLIDFIMSTGMSETRFVSKKSLPIRCFTVSRKNLFRAI